MKVLFFKCLPSDLSFSAFDEAWAKVSHCACHIFIIMIALVMIFVCLAVSCSSICFWKRTNFTVSKVFVYFIILF